MPLPLHTKAPDFTLPSTSGRQFTLSRDLQNQACIIYFYPKDFTSGCTKEACEFRDHFEFFKDLDITVVGVSRDSIAAHLAFKKAYNIPFELLSDAEGKAAALYKASLPFLKMTRRISYLLDRDHNISAVYANMFNAKQHIHQMIAQLKS